MLPDVNGSTARYRLRPGDLVLAALILAGSAWAALTVHGPAAHGAPRAVVLIDGARRLAIPLDREQSLPQVFGERHLTLETQPGRIRVSIADCPHQDCVRQGWISRPSQTLVCLPAHVVIRIEGDEPAGPDIDAVSE